MVSAIAPLHRYMGIEQSSLVERDRRINQLRACDRLWVCGLPVEAQGLVGDGGDATEFNLCAGEIALGIESTADCCAR